MCALALDSLPCLFLLLPGAVGVPCLLGLHAVRLTALGRMRTWRARCHLVCRLFALVLFACAALALGVLAVEALLSHTCSLPMWSACMPATGGKGASDLLLLTDLLAMFALVLALVVLARCFGHLDENGRFQSQGIGSDATGCALDTEEGSEM